jgi:hypothetical protein
VSTTRDQARSRVYRAEQSAFGQTIIDETFGLRALQTLGGMVCVDPWWIDAPGGAVPTVVAARRDARTSTARRLADGSWVIRLAPGHDQPPTLSHEIAHVLCGQAEPVAGEPTDAAHGAAFRGAHLAVAALLFGSHGRALLAAAYRSARLDVTDRTGPSGCWPDRGEHGLHGDWRAAIPLGSAAEGPSASTRSVNRRA